MLLGALRAARRHEHLRLLNRRLAFRVAGLRQREVDFVTLRIRAQQRLFLKLKGKGVRRNFSHRSANGIYGKRSRLRMTPHIRAVVRHAISVSGFFGKHGINGKAQNFRSLLRFYAAQAARHPQGGGF